MSDAPRWFRNALAAPYEDRVVEVAHCPIHYVRWGDPGSPGVVLVHGGAAHAHWWTPIAPQLARDCQVVALDLSGHGDSGRREDYPRDLWADEVLAVAEDARIVGAPVLVGHSMGGFVCISAAARFGDRLTGAVILDSPVRRPDPESEEGAHGKAFRNPKRYPDLQTALGHFRVVPEPTIAEPWLIDHVARHSLRELNGEYTWKFDPRVFLRFAPRAAHEVLPEVRCRVALFRAEFGMVTPDIGAYMYELLDRNAPVVEIPNSYHHIPLDQPLSLLTGLRAILADWEHSVPRKRR